MKLLFVCMCNLNRSPTFAKWFKKNMPQHESRSAGTYGGYPYMLNRELMKWADKVIVMDYSQKLFIRKKYGEFIKKVWIVGISDQYNPDDPDLIELIELWVHENKEWLGEARR